MRLRPRILRALAVASRLLNRTVLARSRILNRVQARLVLRLHGSNVLEHHGFRIEVHPRDIVLAKRLILRGQHEGPELALLLRLVRDGDHVVDVGANVGLYSLHLSRAVGPTGRVLAVEPDPETVEILARNLERNGCANVSIARVACGAEDGTARLFLVADHKGRSSLADLEGTGRSVPVRIRRAADLCRDAGIRPRIAKIDVEGAEPEVIAGFDPPPPILLFEFVPDQLKARGHDPGEFLRDLEERGYDLQWIDPKRSEARPSDPTALILLAAESRSVVNLLATRPERP